MEKKQLAVKVAKKTGVSQAVAKKAVKAFTDAVVVSAGRTGTLNLAGLGKIVIASERTGKRLDAKRRLKREPLVLTLTPSRLLEWHVGSFESASKYKTKTKAKSAVSGRF
jgi:nucleoid DNA-binding protein